nr:MAG TPA: hypothetical protein [Caudoviricetes sp.]
MLKAYIYLTMQSISIFSTKQNSITKKKFNEYRSIFSPESLDKNIQSVIAKKTFKIIPSTIKPVLIFHPQ